MRLASGASQRGLVACALLSMAVSSRICVRGISGQNQGGGHSTKSFKISLSMAVPSSNLHGRLSGLNHCRGVHCDSGVRRPQTVPALLLSLDACPRFRNVNFCWTNLLLRG